MPPLTERFAARVRQLREGKGLSQEALAEAAGLHRTQVSLIERAKRDLRLDTIERLATALGVEPAELFRDPGLQPVADPRNDLAEFQHLYPAVRRLQTIASRRHIDDIFQDNGGKLLQVLLVLGLDKVKGREGNDAVDADGREYELKSVNIELQKQFTTHHHLKPAILTKYRAVTAWYFAVYEHIELRRIYRVTPDQLEDKFFAIWEAKLTKKQETEEKPHLNNPKIPLKFVVQVGELVREFAT